MPGTISWRVAGGWFIWSFWFIWLKNKTNQINQGGLEKGSGVFIEQQVLEMTPDPFSSLSRHAFKRAIERNVSDAEIRQAGTQAESLRLTPKTNMLPVACYLDGSSPW